MRLIKCDTFEFVEPPVEDAGLYPYAILSHTWGQEEVTFQDMQFLPTARQKAGFVKIQKCCELAISQHLNYAWVDTCCIDKTSSAELQEAINSMFRWYQNADVCYAYLRDVRHELSPTERERAFRDSRWFRRGWTLQELIAPQKLYFYTRSWTRYGSKSSESSLISDITGIQAEVLRDAPNDFSQFSIAQRMCWASRRETTRPEDMAYSLLGIFQISMTLIYGEGGPGAFIRLQEQIMQDSDDQSLFAWTSQHPIRAGGGLGLLADSPSCFKDSGNIMVIRDWYESEPYHMTNKGLRLNLQLVPLPSNSDVERKSYLGALTCRANNDPLHVSGIMLSKVHNESDQYVRKDGKIHQIPIRSLLAPAELSATPRSVSPMTGVSTSENRKQRIYVRKRILYPEVQEIIAPGDFKRFRIHVPQHGVSMDPILPYLSAATHSGGRIESWPVEIRSPRTTQFRWNPTVWSWHAIVLFFCPSPLLHFYLAVGWDGVEEQAWAHLCPTDQTDATVIFNRFCTGRPPELHREIVVTWGVQDFSISIAHIVTEREDSFSCTRISLQGRSLGRRVSSQDIQIPSRRTSSWLKRFT